MNTVRSRDGTTIAFDRAGSGPPVVLVGGALSDRAAGTALSSLLASDFTVVAYDRRGRGDSGDTGPYAIEREIEDVGALIEVVGGSARLFGMSSGAVLALDAAAHGLAIVALALYEPPFIVDDTRQPPAPGYVERITDLIDEGRRGEAVESFMTEGVGMPAEAVRSMRDAPFWPRLEALAHTLPYDIAIMSGLLDGDPLPSDRWAAARVPTLVMDGGASPTWARNAVGALADVLPGAERRTLEGQTHQAEPGILAAALSAFFSGDQARPAAGPPI